MINFLMSFVIQGALPRIQGYVWEALLSMIFICASLNANKFSSSGRVSGLLLKYDLLKSSRSFFSTSASALLY